MAARCDGSQLGKLIFYQLPKQQLMFDPMQIESRIGQDQNISKDLTLWNQQGSRVLRGNITALPVTGGFYTLSPFTFRRPKPVCHSSRKWYWLWVTG